MLSGLENAVIPVVHPAGVMVGRPIPAVPPVLAPVDKAPIAALLGSMLVHCLGAVL